MAEAPQLHGGDDAYSAQPGEAYPGAKQRSRPGQGPQEETYEKVLDPSTGRWVSLKPANRAFLASRARRTAADASKAQGPPSTSPSTSTATSMSTSTSTSTSTATSTSASLSWRQLLLIVLFLPILSQFLTRSYTFTLSSRLAPPLRAWWARTPLNVFRPNLKQFTLPELARFDGSDPWLPIYLAIDGDVYDVTRNRRIYGKGGSYNLMAGVDASRSFVTGCFATHRTHDLRGLSPADLKSLDHWKSFFAQHEKYTLVGRVVLPPIDPHSPIPPPCVDSEAQADGAAGTSTSTGTGTGTGAGTGTGHRGAKPAPVEANASSSPHGEL